MCSQWNRMYSSGSKGDVLGPKQQAGPQSRSAHSISLAPKGLCNHSFNKTHDNKDWHPPLWQLGKHVSSVDHTSTHTQLAFATHPATRSHAQTCIPMETTLALSTDRR